MVWREAPAGRKKNAAGSKSVLRGEKFDQAAFAGSSSPSYITGFFFLRYEVVKRTLNATYRYVVLVALEQVAVDCFRRDGVKVAVLHQETVRSECLR